MAETYGDGLGFDVLSFEVVDDSEGWIEVKTTGLGKYYPFVVTANKVRCSEDLPEWFHLHRVFDFARSPGYTSLKGALVSLSPWSTEPRLGDDCLAVSVGIT